MRTKKGGAARRKAAGRRPTKQRQPTRRQASRTAPAAGTAEDPVPAYSSSEYASSSEDEGEPLVVFKGAGTVCLTKTHDGRLEIF